MICTGSSDFHWYFRSSVVQPSERTSFRMGQTQPPSESDEIMMEVVIVMSGRDTVNGA